MPSVGVVLVLAHLGIHPITEVRRCLVNAWLLSSWAGTDNRDIFVLKELHNLGKEGFHC